MELLSLIPIIVITFLPILLWGYIFSYLDNSPLGARRFGLGIIAGAISVIPVLFLNDIMKLGGVASWNIFPLLVQGGNTIGLLISLLITLELIAGSIFVFSFGFFSVNIPKIFGTFLRNAFIILFIGILFSIFHLVLFKLNIFDRSLANGGVSIGGVVFGTLKLVLFYYIIIALIEETSKHFSVLTSSLPSIDSVKKGVLFSIFIALGFGFIENILYLKNIAEQSGFWSSGVVSTWIFRSIFSLMTHIICSVIVGLYFSRAFLKRETSQKRSNLNENRETERDVRKLYDERVSQDGIQRTSFSGVSYVKTVLYGFLFSIVIHAIFDISLTIGFTGIIFIYFFGGYLGITRIFYEEEN